MDYTQIKKLRGKADLTLHGLEKVIKADYGADISYSLLNRLENGNVTRIVRYSKRNAVEAWMKRELAKHNRRRRKSHMATETPVPANVQA